MRSLAIVALVLAAAAATVRAESPAVAPASDPVVDRLVAEALAVRPELHEANARARGDRERVPQAEAFPDPMVSLGIQNDGFNRIEIGTMGTSFVSIGASQALPWPGKRALRGKVAALGADQTLASVDRVRLSTEGDVRRAYLDLLLARDRLQLLDELATLWKQSEDVARARYEVGSAPQSDVLRAQLERTRIQQRRFALEADARERQQALNRLRGRPLDEAIATSSRIRDLAEPVMLPAADETSDAEARSPELRAARIGVRRSDTGIDLARREQYPDFGVSAGVMLRGALEPMWQVGVSMNLPVLWGRTRRKAAISEARAVADADRQVVEAVGQVVRERVAERRSALAALKDTLRLYRDGLLVQSNATVESTLSQYRVGRVTFASVLEAIAGYIADEDAYLQTLAGAQRIAIARAEVSLDPVASMSASGLAPGGMPGAGGVARGVGRASGEAAGAAAVPAASGMGGM